MREYTQLLTLQPAPSPPSPSTQTQNSNHRKSNNEKTYKIELLQAAVDLQPLSDALRASVSDFVFTLQHMSESQQQQYSLLPAIPSSVPPMLKISLL